jgi:hypothetical protein
MTLARLIVASADLLDLHGDIYRRCLPSTAQAPFPHCAPGRWTPHATLGRRFTAGQVARALDVIEDLSADISAEVVGLRRWTGTRGSSGCCRLSAASREVPGVPGFERLSALNPARSRA